MKKGRYLYQIAAMKGHVQARHNLRCKEGKVGSIVRAYKHLMIAASAGDNVYTYQVGYKKKNGRRQK
jgi:TPR repeat protein